MGAWRPFHASSFSTADQPRAAPRPAGNPNPWKFEVLSCTQHGGHFLSVIHYPDCTSYEGKKVIVSRVDPRKTLVFDPHFTESGHIVARFEPTEEGIAMAGRFVLSLSRRADITLRED